MKEVYTVSIGSGGSSWVLGQFYDLDEAYVTYHEYQNSQPLEVVIKTSFVDDDEETTTSKTTSTRYLVSLEEITDIMKREQRKTVAASQREQRKTVAASQREQRKTVADYRRELRIAEWKFRISELEASIAEFTSFELWLTALDDVDKAKADLNHAKDTLELALMSDINMTTQPF